MLKINRDEYGDRAINEANRILKVCTRKKTALKYKVMGVILMASALFLLILKLI